MARQIGSLLELQRTLHDIGQRPVVVNFHGAWRESLNGIDSDLERFHNLYPIVLIVNVNVEEVKGVAEKFEIRNTPTFVVFYDGVEVETVVGVDPQRLELLFEKYNTTVNPLLALHSTNTSISNSLFIIREVYENGNSTEYFENQLDAALEAEIQTIIIEPTKLGVETARWISVGNFLHRVSVFSGFGSLATALALPAEGRIFFPLCVVGFVTAAVYTVSWQFDSCCQYQVERDKKRLKTLPLVSSTAPVVLVRRVHYRSRVLRTSAVLGSSCYCAWLLYRWYSL